MGDYLDRADGDVFDALHEQVDFGVEGVLGGGVTIGLGGVDVGGAEQRQRQP